MPGSLMWGWDATNKVWRPVVVNSEGKLIIDPSEVILDKLGDVEVPTPGDQYFVYWDAATSLWKCRALVDADIPATIARDAEVATAVSDHAALTTGIHGITLAYPGESSVQALDLAAHQARHQLLGNDRLFILLNLLNCCVAITDWATRDAWTDYIVGTGVVIWDAIMQMRVISGATSGGIGSLYTGIVGGLSPHSSGRPWSAIIQSASALTDSEAWIVTTKATGAAFPAITDWHIGWRILNGEIYASNGNGAAGTQTDTGKSIATAWSGCNLLIIGTAGTNVKFYIDGVLKATHTTNLPSQWNFRCWLGIKNAVNASKELRITQTAWGFET